jgi:hypothetical protein
MDESTKTAVVKRAPRESASRPFYMVHLLDGLRASGGELSSSAARDYLQSNGIARASDLMTVQKSGETRFAKELRFARLELVEAGLIEVGRSAIWRLSPRGWATLLNIDEARRLINARRHGATNSAIRQRPTPGPTRGPVPVDYATHYTRRIGAAASVYIFRFGALDVWKIGQAECVHDRLKEVNRHVPYEVTGVRWHLYARWLCRDSREAYPLEQAILGALSAFRTNGERVVCPVDQLKAGWRLGLGDAVFSGT